MRQISFWLLATASLNCYAWSATSDDKWRTGWGQGVSELQVTQGSGNKIDVTCASPTDLPGGSTVKFTVAGNSVESGEILTIFDNEKPETFQTNSRGYIESSSRAWASNFTYLLEKFKKHRKVYVRFPDGNEATFTLKGASKAIVDNDCKAAFYYY